MKKEMPVEMEFEGYEAGRYGYPHGKIVNCANTITVMEGNNFFKAEIIINNKHASYPILKDMKCSASILLSDESIAYHIFPALGH